MGVSNEKHDLESARTWATVVYALQAASFVIGITYIAAVIIDYAKWPDVAGTWLESHFRWQIRTFWYSLLWAVLGLLTIYLLIGYMIWIADMIWIVYRIVAGWLRLSEGKEMYAQVF